MKIITTIVLLLSALFSIQANAQEKELKVGIYETAPFVMKSASGEYSGFDIDLWNAIASDLNYKSIFIEAPSFPDLLDYAKNSNVNVALSSITVNKDRHEVMDFSTPYFNSGLAIMVRESESNSFLSSLESFFVEDIPNSIKSSYIYLIFIFIVFISGLYLMNVIENKIRNSSYNKCYLSDLLSCVFYCSCFIILFLFSMTTARISTKMTADHFTYKISSPKDLRGKSVATVAGTTSVPFLTSFGANTTSVIDIDDAYAMLKAGQVDAIVYDAPSLQYYANTVGSGSVAVVSEVFAQQPYGIAMPKNSDLVRAIDGSILKLKENGVYDTIYNRYFGK